MMWHCHISLDKILELTLEGTKILNIGEKETYQFVREQKAMGRKYFSGCDNIDKEGKCAGHENIL